jgi:broad specificity phosphatase PhoE
MKTIYFVRHGESKGNASDRYQMDSSPLSERGRAQAGRIAKRTSRLSVEAVISSTMPRASETAEIISDLVGLPVEHSDLFVERKRPSAQKGLIRTSPEAEEMDKGIIRSSAEAGYRYADEENFDDLTLRSGQVLTYLEKHPANQLLVVTHGLFLRVLLAKAIYGANLTGEECTNIIGTMQTANTGITVFTYDAERSRPWHVITWNDHAHLG